MINNEESRYSSTTIVLNGNASQEVN